jgi:hypothetical protein
MENNMSNKITKNLFAILVIILLLIFSGCTYLLESDKSLIKNNQIFVLCEGNFGYSNASLWTIDPNEGHVSGPIYRDLTDNLLGDVGQSLMYHNGKLYVIVNNSHVIRVFNISEEISFDRNIELPDASPRFLIINEDFGYVSCWNLNAVLKIDLNDSSGTLDTIPVPGKPEEMLIYGDALYVSLILKQDWTSGDQILKISLDDHIIEQSFTVIPGPSSLIMQEGALYISSTYYDETWNKFAGLSRIHLNSNTVELKNLGPTTELVGDLLIFQNHIYRINGSGIAEVRQDLTLQTSAQFIEESNVYSALGFDDMLLFGTTDFTAPDTVYLYNDQGYMSAEFLVGGLPGSMLAIGDSDN